MSRTATCGLTHLALAVPSVERALLVPGEPCLAARDRDGNLIEMWFELPTPEDPPARRE